MPQWWSGWQGASVFLSMPPRLEDALWAEALRVEVVG